MAKMGLGFVPEDRRIFGPLTVGGESGAGKDTRPDGALDHGDGSRAISSHGLL